MQTRRLHQLRGDANKGDRHDAAIEGDRQDAAIEGDRHDAAIEQPLWVVDVGAGQLRLAPGSDALKELITQHGLTKTARVYVLSAASKKLGEIAELQAMFEGPPDASPTTSETEPEAPHAEPETPRAEPEASPAEPLIALAATAAVENVEAEPSVTAIKAAAEDAGAAPSNHARDDDFSLLDRPFDDGDYFEKPPRARWVRAAGVAALVFLLGGGGYRLVHSRSVTRSPAPAPTRDSTAAVVAAPAVAEPVVVAPPPVAPPTAAEATQQPGSLGAPSPSYSTRSSRRGTASVRSRSQSKGTRVVRTRAGRDARRNRCSDRARLRSSGPRPAATSDRPLPARSRSGPWQSLRHVWARREPSAGGQPARGPGRVQDVSHPGGRRQRRRHRATLDSGALDRRLARGTTPTRVRRGRDRRAAVAFLGGSIRLSPDRHEPTSEISAWCRIPDRFGLARRVYPRL